MTATTHVAGTPYARYFLGQDAAEALPKVTAAG
jgi:hypothetical protein